MSRPLSTDSRQDWATPSQFFRELNETYNFALDVCAMQSSTKVPFNWYGLDHPDPVRRDCFTRDWHIDAKGWAFMNPPYGKELPKFLAKATEEYQKGLKQVWLVTASTSTKWFHKYALPHELIFIKGRLKFDDGKMPAPFASMLVVLK
jgi:site-specific DNA-methyltransferase (adenine-specific)